MNLSNATVRWTVARRQLDGGDTMIESNPSIRAKYENAADGRRFLFDGDKKGGI